MTKSLTENTWVYTDKGIENVHWCNVDGVDELVTPKGKVLATVPSYDEICYLNKRLGELAKDVDELHSSFPDLVNDYKRLEQQLAEAHKCIKHCSTHPCCEKYLLKWGVK